MRIVRGILFVLAMLVFPCIILFLKPTKPQPIVGVQPLVSPPPAEEPKPYIFSEEISEEDIVELKDHELGSKGYLVGDRIECTGEKGDNCIISIFRKGEHRHIYFLACGITDKPIASFDQETRTWTINYTRKVELL